MILNLTQHVATPDQVEVGVVNPSEQLTRTIRELLTFDDLPTQAEIDFRAETLATICQQVGVVSAMIGGAPYLMSQLEKALLKLNITPLYAFSKRTLVERIVDGGEVVKIAIFKHQGFVEVHNDD